MQTSVSQMIALTGYGNALVQRKKVPPFFLNNDTCTFCETVQFVRPAKQENSFILVANTPDHWFVELINRGCIGLRLVQRARSDPRVSDRMSDGWGLRKKIFRHNMIKSLTNYMR